MKSETAVQTDVRLAASRDGGRLWRNNSGVAQDLDTGQVVRFGMSNDSKEVNAKTKSSDLIGIMPITITQSMVGKKIGVMYCREVKREGWTYKGTPIEVAQKNFIDIVNSLGGNAGFTTGE